VYRVTRHTELFILKRAEVLVHYDFDIYNEDCLNSALFSESGGWYQTLYNTTGATVESDIQFLANSSDDQHPYTLSTRYGESS